MCAIGRKRTLTEGWGRLRSNSLWESRIRVSMRHLSRVSGHASKTHPSVFILPPSRGGAAPSQRTSGFMVSACTRMLKMTTT